jgi:hypothetical protein
MFTMEYSEIQVLIEKYLNGQANESEKKLVDAWYDSFESSPGLTSELSQELISDMQAKTFVTLLHKLDLNKD